ncbi:sensor domain-containing diguanylate cyclase [Anaeromicrobium sp.]|uniref:sensor domain-containing diguanylate cyclase n=1 Tax=Anaeromicrobium sp. TaxID=1929132 RepID=UPI0026007C5B|nr:sensor domain-containing diguanylate cyclase [Anaeromicrobium sp.]
MFSYRLVFIHITIVLIPILGIIFTKENSIFNYCLLLALTMLVSYSLKLIYKNHIDNRNKIGELLCTIEEKERYNNIKDVILQVSNSIIHINDKDTLFQTIVDSAVEIIDKADLASILIATGDGTFQFKGIYGCSLSLISHVRLNIKETFLRNYDKENLHQSTIINHTNKFNEKYMDKDTFNLFTSLNLLNIKSTLSTPIIVDGELYGFFNVDNNKSHNIFTEEDQVIMEYLSGQLSIAIRNQCLFEKTLFLSQYDGLTKVYHRHYFEEIYSNVYKRALRYKENFSLAILDLNDLKIINDIHGHIYGDKAIALFSKVLKENFRESDIIGRYGGDEFIIVTLDSHKDQIEEKFKLIQRDLIEKPILYNENKITITFSYGISSFPEDSTDSDSLIKIADFRMYENKKKQKDI